MTTRDPAGGAEMTETMVDPLTTTTWGITTAALVGTAALMTTAPRVGIPAFSGLLIGLASRWFAGGHARVALGASLLPVGFAGVVAGTGSIADLGAVTVTLALAAALVGTGLGAAFLGGVPPSAFRRAGDAGIVSAVIVGLSAVLLPVVVAAGGPGAAAVSAFDPFWSLDRRDLAGPVTGFVIATAAVASAIRTAPTAAFADPSRRSRTIVLRTGLFRLVVGVGTLAIVGLFAATVIGAFVPTAGRVTDAVSTSGYLRAALATLAVIGTIGFALALFVRAAWLGSSGSHRGANAAVPTLAGAVVGTTLLVVGSRLAPSPPDPDLLTGALFATALLAGAVGLGVRRYAESIDRVDRSAGTAVALGSGIGGVTLAGSADLGGDVITVVTGGPFAAFCALAAGAFAYRAGVDGNRLVTDLGGETGGRDVQLVRFAWTAVVAGIGVVLATAGLAVATVLSPTLSVPATIGVVGGLLAIVAAAWLLFE